MIEKTTQSTVLEMLYSYFLDQPVQSVTNHVRIFTTSSLGGLLYFLSLTLSFPLIQTTILNYCGFKTYLIQVTYICVSFIHEWRYWNMSGCSLLLLLPDAGLTSSIVSATFFLGSVFVCVLLESCMCSSHGCSESLHEK